MKKPNFLVRALMQLLSLILCLALVLCLLTTAVILDLKQLTSSGGIQTILNAFTASGSQAQPSAAVPANGQPYLVPLSNTVGAPGDIQIPTDALTDSSLLTDYIYDIISGSMGSQTEITKDQVQNFINDSSIMDYTSEKISSYVQDAINGKENTTITTDELMDLFEENQTLLEEHFEITVTEEMKSDLRTQVEKVVDENDLNGEIRQNINSALDTPIDDASGTTMRDIMEAIGQATAPKVIASAIALCLVLILLLLALNFYNLPMGLTWASYACLFIGSLLSIACLATRSPDALIQTMPDEAEMVNAVCSVFGVIAPVHYGIFITGILLLAGSIVWRVLRRKNK